MEALSAQQFRSFAVIGAVNQATDPARAIGALAKWKSLAFDLVEVPFAFYLFGFSGEWWNW